MATTGNQVRIGDVQTELSETFLESDCYCCVHGLQNWRRVWFLATKCPQTERAEHETQSALYDATGGAERLRALTEPDIILEKQTKSSQEIKTKSSLLFK